MSRHDSITSEDLEGVETVDDVYTMDEIKQQQASYLKETKEKLDKAREAFLALDETLITKSDPKEKIDKLKKKLYKKYKKAKRALKEAENQIERQGKQMKLLQIKLEAREQK